MLTRPKVGVSPKVLLVNPDSMSPAESHLVRLVLGHNVEKGNYAFFTAKHYPIHAEMLPDNLPADVQALVDKYEAIKPTYLLIARHCSIDPSQIHYDIFAKSTKTAAHSIIQQVLGVLTPQPDGTLIFKYKDDRIAKRWDRDVELATRERELSQRVKKLRAKNNAVIDVDKQYFSSFIMDESLTSKQNVMVMRYIEGDDFSDLLDKDRKKESLLELYERVELTRQIIFAMQKQLNDNNIIHRDVAPKNVRINLDAVPYDVTFIDYGESIDLNAQQNLKRVYGTPIYMPPEELDLQPVGLPSNMYGLGWMLAMLWHADDHPVKKMNNEYRDPVRMVEFNQQVHTKIIRTAHNCKFTNMFRGIKGLSFKDKRAIKNILHKTVDPDPKERCDTEELLKVFDEVQFNLQTKWKDETTVWRLKRAYDAGQALRSDLNALSKSAKDQAVLMQESFRLVKQALLNIPDAPEALGQLYMRADITLLFTVLKRDEALDKLTKLEKQYNYTIDEFRNLSMAVKNAYQKLVPKSALSLNEQQRKIVQLYKRVLIVDGKYAVPMSINNVELVITKLGKHTLAMAKQLDQACSMKVTGPSLQSDTSMCAPKRPDATRG